MAPSAFISPEIRLREVSSHLRCSRLFGSRFGLVALLAPTSCYLFFAAHTEGLGFEPRELIKLGCFQGNCIRPLCHPSRKPRALFGQFELHETCSRPDSNRQPIGVLADPAGFEPATFWLTARRSATELRVKDQLGVRSLQRMVLLGNAFYRRHSMRAHLSHPII